jgi:hypothetical protein
MACNESTRVNVGDPDRSQKDRVSGNKTKNQGLQEVYLEVRCVIVLRAWESQVHGEGHWVNKLLVKETSWGSQKAQ